MTRSDRRAVAPVARAAPRPAHGQEMAVEVSQSVGVSSEEIAGAGTQVRLLGDAEAGTCDSRSKARGAPARGEHDPTCSAPRIPTTAASQVIEAYGEYFFAPSGAVSLGEGGRYRTPFGISAASDHAYIGFLRPPLIRYGDYYALSSGYLEHGVDVVVGAPRLSVEVSVGAPGDVGDAIRRPGSRHGRCAPKAGRLADRRRQLHRHDAVSAGGVCHWPGALRRRRRALDGRAACRCVASGLAGGRSTAPRRPAATST